jgi:septal ring factor EnvC (AmiA/AmiB activator)
MAIIRFIVGFSVLMILTLSSTAQTRDVLEEKRRGIIKDISYTNDLLKKNIRKRNLSINQLAIIREKISLRKQLIYQLETDIETINSKILENQIIIESLKGDLEDIKEEYAKLIYYAYKNRSSYDRIMFVFSATDFNQAYRRLKYLRHYNQYRRKQAASIHATQGIIQEKIAELSVDKDKKYNLLKDKKHEANLLADEQSNQKSAVQQLSQKEQELKN